MTDETAKNPYSAIQNEQTPAVPKIETITSEVKAECALLLEFAQDCRTPPLAGMAANQVARDGKRCELNVCFIRLLKDNTWLTAVNPEITELTGATFNSREGCLTWPRTRVQALRHEGAVVKYTTLEGKTVVTVVMGHEAVVWQHEVDHLRGVNENVLQPLRSDKQQAPNERCKCGSGLKHKRCCGRLETGTALIVSSGVTREKRRQLSQ